MKASYNQFLGSNLIVSHPFALKQRLINFVEGADSKYFSFKSYMVSCHDNLTLFYHVKAAIGSTKMNNRGYVPIKLYL